VAAAGLVIGALLAARHQTGARLILGVDGQGILAPHQEFGDIHRPGGVSPAVAPRQPTIRPHPGVVVGSANVQQDALPLPTGRHLERATVPDAGMKIHVRDARENALRAEGHDDLPVEALRLGQSALHAASAGVKLEGPAAVQVQPLLPHDLRARVLGTGDLHADSFPHRIGTHR